MRRGAAPEPHVRQMAALLVKQWVPTAWDAAPA